ncbi:hypothetical protein EMIT051CA3_50412 [Pseudomonas chlororaphis]
MKAVILAAGRGSRLKDLTAALPKPLARLAGKPLLEWQLQALENAGSTRCIWSAVIAAKPLKATARAGCTTRIGPAATWCAA